MISSYTGASTAKPIQIHSEDVTVEGAEIGTQLVRYTAVAGGTGGCKRYFRTKLENAEGLGYWAEQSGRKDGLDDLCAIYQDSVSVG